MTRLGVKIKRSRPYTPQQGGRYERVHNTIKKKMVMAITAAEQKDELLTAPDALKTAVFMYK